MAVYKDVSSFVGADGLVRVYPAPASIGAGLVWAHGGGFAFGDLDMPEADFVACTLAAAGTTVVSVDYRLVSDNTRFPSPLEDVEAAWGWAHERKNQFGIDRLAIGGASAGGNLAAAAALRLAGGALEPDAVILAYPTLLAIQPAPDADLRRALDADPLADTFGPEAVRFMYERYIGGPAESASIFIAPGLATPADLAKYPPTFIIDADTDELRMSSAAFARTLAEAGREVVQTIEPGTRHGYLNDPDDLGTSITLERIARRLASIPCRQPR